MKEHGSESERSAANASHAERRLEGHGAGLVREYALARRVQTGLERLYGLDPHACVTDFLEVRADGAREEVHVREADDGAVEMRVVVPAIGDAKRGTRPFFDRMCQIIEGVSHFVVLAERALHDRSTTHLELELQAEVDKFVVLSSQLGGVDAARRVRLRSMLYDDVTYVHAAHTVRGQRYRLASHSAHRFVRRIETELNRRERMASVRAELRRFFHMGQQDKLRVALG